MASITGTEILGIGDRVYIGAALVGVLACTACAGGTTVSERADIAGLSAQVEPAYPNFADLPPLPGAAVSVAPSAKLDSDLIKVRLAELEGAPTPLSEEEARTMLSEWTDLAKSWLKDPRAEPPAITGALTEAWAEDQRTLTTQAGKPY
jgi:hypothetical protein